MTPTRPASIAHSLPALLAGLALALGACSEGEAAGRAAGSRTEAPDEDVVRREIRDLVTALTPMTATALPVEKSSWFMQRKKTLERMKSAGRDHGLEALRVFQSEGGLPEVRAGLLEVAAFNAPRETEPLLVELVTKFGPDLYLRTKAAEFLGETAPEKAIEVLHPILQGRYDDRTFPPEERLLDAWLTASGKLGIDPVPLVAEIAVDLDRTQDVRHLATRALGQHDSPQSRQALQTLAVESSGNSYIRRLSIQSLKQILTKDEFCGTVNMIRSREVDQHFQVFLDNVVQEACR